MFATIEECRVVFDAELAKFDAWISDVKKSAGISDKEDFNPMGVLDQGDWETYQVWRGKISVMMDVLGFSDEERMKVISGGRFNKPMSVYGLNDNNTLTEIKIEV